MTLITSITAVLLGYTLSKMGYGPSSWEFWWIGTLYIMPNCFWMIKDWRHNH